MSPLHQLKNEFPIILNQNFQGGQNLIEVILSKIMIDETRDEQVIVMKEKLGARSFPIVISIFEATAISLKVKGIETPRPMTHDLLKNTIENLGAAVEKIF